MENKDEDVQFNTQNYFIVYATEIRSAGREGDADLSILVQDDRKIPAGYRVLFDGTFDASDTYYFTPRFLYGPRDIQHIIFFDIQEDFSLFSEDRLRHHREEITAEYRRSGWPEKPAIIFDIKRFYYAAVSSSEYKDEYNPFDLLPLHEVKDLLIDTPWNTEKLIDYIHDKADVKTGSKKYVGNMVSIIQNALREVQALKSFNELESAIQVATRSFTEESLSLLTERLHLQTRKENRLKINRALKNYAYFDRREC